MKATSVFCACLVLAGCSGFFGSESRQGVASSLVDSLDVPTRTLLTGLRGRRA